MRNGGGGSAAYILQRSCHHNHEPINLNPFPLHAPHQEECKRSERKIRAIGEGALALLEPEKHQEKGSETAKDDTGHRDEEESISPQPEAKRCDELHIAPAQRPAREDGKHEEGRAANSGREEMIAQAGKLEEREEKSARCEGKHHRIKETVLLEVSRRHEQKESGGKEQEEKLDRARCDVDRARAAEKKGEREKKTPQASPFLDGQRKGQDVPV